MIMENSETTFRSQLRLSTFYGSLLLLPLTASLLTPRFTALEAHKGYNLSYALESVPTLHKNYTYLPVQDFDLKTTTENRYTDLKLFLWSQTAPSPSAGNFNTLYSTLLGLRLWMRFCGSVITLTPDSVFSSFCAGVACFFNEICIPQYYCLMRLGNPPLIRNTSETTTLVDDGDFSLYLADRWNLNSTKINSSTWTCSIAPTSTDYSFGGLAPDQTAPCDSDAYSLTSTNWRKLDVDSNLNLALRGGVDQYGLFWEGRRDQEPIATTIGRQFWNSLDETCSIKNPCRPAIGCQTIGSFTGLAFGTLGRPVKVPWVLLASSAVKNLNRQFNDMYEQVVDAINSLALDAFSIDEFSPSPNPNTDVKNTLTGLGTLFTVLGGLIPAGGLSLELVGTITSGIGSFIGNAAPSDPLAAQKNFATNLLAYYKGLQDGLESLTT